MDNNVLSPGKKNLPDKNSDAEMKSNTAVKRSDELSNSGLEFGKPLGNDTLAKQTQKNK